MAQIFKTGSYFVFRGTQIDPWIAFSKDNRLFGGVPSKPDMNYVFWIQKYDGLDNTIRSGDKIRIRGTEGDPWLYVPPAGGPVIGRGPEDASLLVIEGGTVDSPMPYRTPITTDSYFRLRGAEKDPWFHVPPGPASGPVTGGSRDAASTFMVKDVVDLPPLPPPTEKIHVAPGKIEIGWMNLLPCVRVEWNPWPELYTAEQRLYAFAIVPPNSIAERLFSEVKACVGTAVAAAGLAAIFASPGAAFGAFTTTFKGCLTAKGLQALEISRLETETKCMW
jgi:hypothetical protein